MFCIYCGGQNAENASFCSSCGKAVGGQGSASSAPPGSAAALPIEPNVAAPGTRPADVAAAAATVRGVAAGRRHRPKGVIVLAVLSFLALIPTISLAVVLQSYSASASAAGDIPAMQRLMQVFPVLSQGNRDMVTQASAGAAIMFGMAVFFALISYGMWRLRKWARILAIVCGALGALRAAALIFIVPGTLIWQLIVIGINFWIVMYLLKPHVKQAFQARVS